MRDVPMICAKKLGAYTRVWNTFPIYYTLFMFVALPGVLFGISSLYEGKTAAVTLGIILTIALLLAIARGAWWVYKEDGFNKIQTYMQEKQRAIVFKKNLVGFTEVVPCVLTWAISRKT